jgi:hypothetical protein
MMTIYLVNQGQFKVAVESADKVGRLLQKNLYLFKGLV